MSKVASAIGTVAGVIATVAAFIPGAQPIAAAAGAISAISGTVAQLTAKAPSAQGSVFDVVIDPNGPMPYSMGRTYVPGHQVFDVGYGPDATDTPNPNRSTVYIYSCAGPVEQIQLFANDYQYFSPPANGAVGGHYAGFISIDHQLGLTPEPYALKNPHPSFQFSQMPNWSANHKLSGFAAAMWTYRFDAKGKVFTGGVPKPGAIGKWVLCYDPRKDSTYPGGLGSHRINDEATWEWTENGALHALTYAYGRYSQNPLKPGKVFGVGLDLAGIDVPKFVTAANINDANGWTIGGTVYEPGDKWNNLKLIMESAGMSPIWRGALLSCKVHRPKIQVDTITANDLADGQWEVPAMQPWRNRINVMIPEFRSEAHEWKYVPGTEVKVQSYIDEDGEEKPRGHKFTLCQNGDQAAQLCMYKITDARELGPIVLPLKPRFLDYGPGDAIYLDLPELGLDHLCEVVGSDYDIERGVVTMSFVTDDPAKHPLALGQVTVAPPSPALVGGDELDDLRDQIRTAEVVERVVTSDEFVQSLGTALDAEAIAREQSIQAALTAAQAARDVAISQAVADYAAGTINEAQFYAALTAADQGFAVALDQAISVEQQERQDAITHAIGLTAAERDAAIAQATADFNNNLLTQAGFDAAVAAANESFNASLDAARGRLEDIQAYIAEATQIVRNNDGAITGITYFDENGNAVTTPYEIFWNAFKIVTDGQASNTPFLYDAQADVVYMDTAFIRDLSVETIHIRDGSITRTFALEQRATSGPSVKVLGNSNDPLANQKAGSPIIISTPGVIGSSIYTNFAFKIFTDWSSRGVVDYQIRARTFTDPGLTEASALTSSPGRVMITGTAHCTERLTVTINGAFIDDFIPNYTEAYVVYQLYVGKNVNYNHATTVRLQAVDFHSLLTKR